jgi:hypothetical protein
MTFTGPVSSSNVTKMTPLAVSGRCRPVTMPQPLRRSRGRRLSAGHVVAKLHAPSFWLAQSH